MTDTDTDHPGDRSTVPAASAHDAATWSEIVERSVRSTLFGTIHLKIHDGRVVEIEAMRKIRPRTSPHAFSNDPHERE